MKKILLFASALAGLFLAGSCQKENLEPAAQGGVTYEISLPGGPQTKGEDGYRTYDLHYEVYKTADATALASASLLFEKTVPMEGNTKTLTLDLLNDQDYTILFWANKAGANENNLYFDLTDLRNVVVNTATANNDNRDAFCGMDQLVNHDGAQSRTVELKRPFAQINIATLVPTVAQIGYDVKPTHSYVKVSSIPTAFNVFTGLPVGNTTAVEFSTTDNQALIPEGSIKVNNTDYNWVAMNYVLVPESVVDVEYQITTVNGTVKNTIPSVPVKKNYRTNIIGNLLTSSATYNIVLLPGFEEGDVVRRVADDSEELAAAVADAKSGETIYIDGTVTMPYFTDKALTFIGLSEKAVVKQSPATHIDAFYAGAELNFEKVTLVGTSYTTNTQGYQKAVKETYTDCKFQDYIMFAGDVTIVNNCEFTSNVGQYFWTGSADNITFTECTFNGLDRAVKVCTVGNAGKRVVTFTDCEFSATTPEKAAIEIDGSQGSSYKVYINGCTHTGFAAGANTGVTLFNVKGADNVKVIVDGSEWKGNGLFEDENGNMTVSSTEALMTALSTSPAQVNVMAGSYTFPASSIKNAVEIICEEGTVFTGTSGLNINGATVIGATFENKEGIAASGTIYGTFKNCTFEGEEALRWCYSTAGKEVVFEDCVIKTDFRGFHFDGMEGDVLFKNCEINGFNAFGGEGTATFEGCVFGNDESSYNGLNTYANTVLKNCQFNFISGKTNFIDMEGIGYTLTITNCTATLDGVAKPVTDFVGGSKIDQNTVILDGKVYVSSVAGLIAAVKQGGTVVTMKDGNFTFPKGTHVDLRNKTLTIVGSENVVFDVTGIDTRDQFVTGATLKFEGVTLNFGKVNYMGFANTASLTYKNCNINGLQFLTRNDVVFEGCSLNSNGAEHSVWTYGAKNVTFTDCDFTYGDRAVNCYSDNDVDGGKQTVNFTDCTFATSNTASEGAVEINSCFFSVGIEVNMDGCTAPAYGQMAYVSPWDSTDGSKTTININ